MALKMYLVFNFRRLFSPSLKVSKKVCHTRVGQKLREETDFLETGCFWPRAVSLRQADLTPRPKITCTELEWSWKFHQDPFIPSKVIQLFNQDRQTHRQTDRQADICPPIHIWMGEIFYAFFWFLSLPYVCFAHFIHEG
jgi:hypothetical protein